MSDKDENPPHGEDQRPQVSALGTAQKRAEAERLKQEAKKK